MKFNELVPHTGQVFADEILEEGWKEKMASLAAAGLIGGAGVGGMALKKALTSPTQPSAVSQQQAPAVEPVPVKPPVKQVPEPSNLKPSEEYLKSFAVRAGIVGVELAQFLAQCAKESAGFKDMVENEPKIKSFRAYEPKYEKDPKTKKLVNVNKLAKDLGNIHPGDGKRYRGRGFIQVTGRGNYKAIGERLGLPLEENPHMIEDPKIAAATSVEYWKIYIQPRVKDFTNTTRVTKFVNGSTKTVPDRERFFNHYMNQLGLTQK